MHSLLSSLCFLFSKSIHFIAVNSNASIDYKGADGRNEEYAYNITQVVSSKTHEILSKLSPFKTPTSDIPEKFIKLRQQSTIDEYCRERVQIVDNSEYNSKLRCFQTGLLSDMTWRIQLFYLLTLVHFCLYFHFAGCLFNIKNDPCEFNDLSQNEPSLVDKFEKQLNAYKQQLVPQMVADADPNCDPSQWDHYWTPWITDDDQDPSDTTSLLPFKLIIFVTALYALFILVRSRYKKY